MRKSIFTTEKLFEVSLPLKSQQQFLFVNDILLTNSNFGFTLRTCDYFIATIKQPQKRDLTLQFLSCTKGMVTPLSLLGLFEKLST